MTSTSKATFTAGPAHASGEVRDVSGYLLWGGEIQPILPCGEYRGPIASVLSCAHIDGISNDEAKANADLIAEAFTVAHETGLTPRQLADQRDELLAALREIETICTESAGDCRRRMGTRVGNVIAATRTAIAKAEGGAA